MGATGSHTYTEEPFRMGFHHGLTQYGNRCDWLKDDKFLRDLEGDSVDTEILDEELRSIQEDEPQTCRGKSVKLLESNPFQIVLCVLVLIDAGVVVAEILLDLHAIRGQYREANDHLHQVLDFIKESHVDELGGYHGNNVPHILELLRGLDYNSSTEGGSGAGSGGGSGGGSAERTRRHSFPTNVADMLNFRMFPSLHNAPWRDPEGSSGNGDSVDSSASGSGSVKRLYGRDESVHSAGVQDSYYLRTAIRLLRENIRLKAEIAKLYSGIRENAFLDASKEIEADGLQEYRIKRGASVSDNGARHVVHRHNHNRTRDGHHGNADHFNSYASGGGDSEEESGYKAGASDLDHKNNIDIYVNTNDTAEHSPGHLQPITHDSEYYEEDAHTQAGKLKEIAHILHFCSIGILGIFVAQLFLKLYGMGITEFFKKKMEIFDGVIILASFALDLVFLEGIGGAQGEEAAALLILFLLWRILRVINGIMVTAKKRQEFRIKLQKRARRRAEKKIELLEEDKALKEKEIASLRELSSRQGATEEEITTCKPRRKTIMPRMDTSMGLTSVASLSLSLSMSMSGGAFNSIARTNPILNRRDSIQDILPPSRTRRTSLLHCKPIEILHNHFRSDRASRSTLPRRHSMEKVLEEKEIENGVSDVPGKKDLITEDLDEMSPKTTPQSKEPKRQASVMIEMENELDKIVPYPVEQSSPIAGVEALNQPTTSVANGPIRRASSSSRHSNKDLDLIQTHREDEVSSSSDESKDSTELLSPRSPRNSAGFKGQETTRL